MLITAFEASSGAIEPALSTTNQQRRPLVSADGNRDQEMKTTVRRRSAC
jgi:hypothetical protein